MARHSSRSDSPVSCHMDSIAASPEPPDIRAWFSSYVYESPELNTLDGLQDLDGSDNNQHVGESNVGTDNIDSVKTEHMKSAALVTGSSEPLLFSSEPPDIKNWFSSYLYESPPLDPTLDFAITDHKVREDADVCESGKQDNKDDILVGVEESKESPTQIRTSNVVVKCANLVEDIKVDKDAHDKGALTPTSSEPTPLIGFFSEQIFPGQRTMNNDKKFGDTNGVKLECSLPERVNPTLSNMENNTYILDEKFVFKSVGRADLVRNSLDSTVARKKETELLENGFVSVRKRSKENAGDIANMSANVRKESLGCGVKPVPVRSQTDARVSRTVLSEITNDSSPAILEKSGKWRCPQKNKPNIGPPLKQLRLERWVRRV